MSRVQHFAVAIFLACALTTGALHAQAILSGVSQASGGYLYACALLADGGIDCWGSNAEGQLGDGTTTDRTVPTPVVGLGGDATTVVASTFHACAIVGDGLECWGDNSSGGIGDGTDGNIRMSPTPVSGLGHGVTAVVGSYATTCAIVDGAAMCWGLNQAGQVGNGNEDSPVDLPSQVVGMAAGVTGIALGDSFACALADGGVKCWGDNEIGQLGDGTYVSSDVPVAVEGLGSGVSRIFANGLTACAIVTGGGVKCWGGAMLGNGTATNSTVPIDVTGLASDVVDLTMGNGFACATTSDAIAHCWGYNGFGQFGNDAYGVELSPIAMPFTVFDPMSWAAGGGHMCAIASGALYCWGENLAGQLGIGSALISEFDPTPVLDLQAPVDRIRMGLLATCAISGGALSCFGANNEGGLGDGTNFPRGTPVPVPGLETGVTDVATQGDHTCAIANGSALCWGYNHDGEIGDGTNASRWVATSVTGLDHDVTAIAAGLMHSCAIVAGQAKCWGFGGALGDGDPADSNVPVDVSGLTNVTAIATGAYHSCAIADGAAYCWGWNFDGQLGDGGAPDESAYTPVPVVGLASGVTAIAAGNANTCAIVNGAAMCWGAGKFGEIGDGSYDDSNVPAPVAGLDSGVLALTVGYAHACATTTAGLKCWGENSFGELGSSVSGTTNVPVDVTALPSDATSLTAGEFSTCAIVSGQAYCWGYNQAGQIGNGGVPWLPVPPLAADRVFADGFDG